MASLCALGGLCGERLLDASTHGGSARCWSVPDAVRRFLYFDLSRRLRDLVMPFALKHFASSTAQAWMYTYHIDWSERIEAPLGIA